MDFVTQNTPDLIGPKHPVAFITVFVAMLRSLSVIVVIAVVELVDG